MPTFPALGDELGGYRIERLIGRGGMSVVYLAEQLALGRMVALKLLSPELSEDEEFRQRFIRESRLAGGLEHPNIIPVHEAGDVAGLLFIAMRYVEGSDLKALLAREGPLTLERTIALIGQAAGALDTAHARGLVHRDVKPGNLLVASGEGLEAGEHIYLSDFGLTKKTDSKSKMTSTGQFVGTLDYVAPEQIQGKDVSGRTDLYSLACVTCECLTGKAPFERDSEVAVMYAHLQDPPPKPSALTSGLPASVDAVIERALAKEPGDRYDSCRDFMKALRETAGDGDTPVAPLRPGRVPRRKRPATPAPVPTRPQPPDIPDTPSEAITKPDAPAPRDTAPSRRPSRALDKRLVALAVVPIVAVAAFFMTRGGDTDPRADPNRNDNESQSPEPTRSGGGGAGNEPRFPGQIAYLAETAPGSNEFFVKVANPPDAKPRRIPGTTSVDWRNRRPDWGPDGSFFAYAKEDSSNHLNLIAIDPETERDLEELDVEGAQGSVSVSPDGGVLAFSQTVGGNLDIYVWDMSTGAVERLTTNEGDDDSPEWSPDGSRIVFEREGVGGNDIWTMAADGTDPSPVTDTPGIGEKLPEFHPIDDTLVVYHQQRRGGDFGIYIHDLDEPMIGKGLKVIDTPANEMRPTWSPDGSFIAFDSDAGGNLDVFIIPFDGVRDLPDADDAVQITDGGSDEQSPAWGEAL